MKKLFFVFLILVCANSLFAEKVLPITKGNYLLGGGFSSYYFNSDNFKTLSVGISPNIGYFILDNFALGVNPTAYFQYLKSSTTEDASYSIGSGVFGKYYSNKGFVAELSFEFRNNENESSFYSIFPRIGYAYFINQKVSLEGLIGPRFTFGEMEYFEIPLSIGFQIFL
jgi:hypothetical protein